MFSVRNFVKIVSLALKSLRLRLELAKYNRWSIAEYFRKQGAQIGENCSISVKSLGSEPYLVKLGNHVTISEGVVFLTHEGGVRMLGETFSNLQLFGTIILEDNCFIGQNVVLCPNIRIGKDSIVGANSLVISDVQPNTIAIGVPARHFGSATKFKERCITGWKEQKPPDIFIEEGRNWFTSRYYKDNREKLKNHLTKLLWNQKK
jgi:acetyltransferase-like isoleucine patch superfamily enzyme